MALQQSCSWYTLPWRCWILLRRELLYAFSRAYQPFVGVQFFFGALWDQVSSSLRALVYESRSCRWVCLIRLTCKTHLALPSCSKCVLWLFLLGVQGSKWFWQLGCGFLCKHFHLILQSGLVFRCQLQTHRDPVFRFRWHFHFLKAVLGACFWF